MTQKHYLDETSTFRSVNEGKVTLADLKSGEAYFLFSNCKDGIASNDAFPWFVLNYNTEKPKFVGVEADWVDSAHVDPAVAERWVKFRAIIREAADAGRVTYTDGKNYPAKAKALLAKGYAVFLGGLWRKAEEFAYIGAE